MSGPAPLPTDRCGVLRRHAGRLVRREVAGPRRAGFPTIVFQTGSHEQNMLSNDLLSRDAVEEIVQDSFLAAGRNAARKNIRETLIAAATNR